ncbi:MAG TPA: hypothetical protein VLY23_12485 [Candidatus Acidoferrum sp.]|nr:hypothetical protein [Candidatus Acidoferrum sp.]
MCLPGGLLDDSPQVLSGGVAYYADFIDREDADRLFAAFLNLKWAQETFNTPRKYLWMGVPPASPRHIVPTEWTQEAGA